jgi:uncharacterized protein with von Willebrand factor type A (vWA) domain
MPEHDGAINMQARGKLHIMGAEILGQKVMAFCHLLRAHGLEVTTSRIIDAFRSLKMVNVFRRDDFYIALSANLISRQADRALFNELFQQFWSGSTSTMNGELCLPGWEDESNLSPHSLDISRIPLEAINGEPIEPDDTGEQPHIAMYSPTEVLSHKDFSEMSETELAQVQRLITSMARQMATALSRRKKVQRKARIIDRGRTMRQSLRYGGEVIDLKRRGAKIGKTKMVVLCDISGSMDVYTKFLLQLLYGMQNGLRGVETFVFSTRLTRVTPLLRRRPIEAALALIRETVQDWSGGTKIGPCIREFNDTMAPNILSSKTVVVMISDGWDTGDTSILDAEMGRLKARSPRIIWLNPLLGDPNYQPLCKGMYTALPYVHDFIPVHNAESLRRFGRLVASVA